MADLRFSTFNGGSGVSAAAVSPGYTNRVYVTTERAPRYGSGDVTLSQSDALMAHDASYPEPAGGLRYTKEYRTETRTIETSKPVAQFHGSIDLSSPFSLGGGGTVDVGYVGGYPSGYPPPQKSPSAASSGSRHLVALSEQQQQQVDYQLESHDAYANLPPVPPPPRRSAGRLGSTASGPLSPPLPSAHSNGSATRGGFEFSVTTNSRGHRFGSGSNLSGPMSPQYVNGGGGRGGYEYTVTTETTRSGTRPSVGADRASLHASQTSGLDNWGDRQQQQQQQEQHQYVNYRELRDAPDGGGTAAVTLTRSDKFGSLGSLSGGGNVRVGAGGSASMTLRSQGSASGGGGGYGYGLSVRDIDIHESSAAAAASASAAVTATATTVQESRQQMQRSVQQSRQVATSGAVGSAEFRDPGMADLIAYLRSDSDLTVLNATAFIQHVTFADNDAKAEFYRLGGLQPLVALLQAAVGGGRGGGGGFDLLRNLLGIVRNITFKSNEDEVMKQRDPVSENALNLSLEELKRELCRLGALKLLREVIAASRDEESREIACAAVWNVSSSPGLKPDVIEACAQTIVSTVLLPHSGLEMRGETYVSVHQPMHATFLFYLASGVLRSVSSTSGEQWRDRLRRTEGLPDCLVWPLLSAQAAQLEVNQPGLENCLCAVRNLAYACQEVADPGYVQRQEQAARAAAAGGVGKRASPLAACCGSKNQQQQPPPKQKQQQPQKKQQPAQQKKKQQQPPPAAAAAPIIQRRMPNPIHGMDRLWYPVDMAPLLQHMLDACARPHMLEAAAGAVQNLAACAWQPGADFRRLFRASGGHLLLCQLVAEAQPPVWPAVITMATAYRNVLQDSEPGQVTTQQVQLLASVLPPAVATAANDHQAAAQPVRRPAEQQAAVIAALFAALRRESSSSSATATAAAVVPDELFRCGAVASLTAISRNPSGNTQKVVNFADALLAFLAASGDGAAYRSRLRDEFGWSGPHKADSSVTAQKKPTTGKATAATSVTATTTTTTTKTTTSGGAAAGGQRTAVDGRGGGGGGGAGIAINITSDAGHENAAFQANTLEMRASPLEPQYAQINKGDRSYGYSTTTTTRTTTTRQEQQQQQQQQQEQQQVTDSWV